MSYHIGWAILIVGLVAGCAGIQTMDTSNIETVNMTDFSADPAKYGFADGPPKRDLIVKIDKGHSVPLYLSIDSNIVKLEVDQNKIYFDRDVYLYLSKSKLLLSPDGKRWVSFGKGMKELFGVRKTSIGLGLHANKKQGAIITFQVDFEPER